LDRASLPPDVPIAPGRFDSPKARRSRPSASPSAESRVRGLLEETFTPAEKTLIDRGEAEGIQDIRRRFQRVMEEQFVSIVEQATGRRVRAFLSETNLKEDISVEVFILAEARTDMSDFEELSGEAG
jgi:uncharacterized protein YbcI